MTTPVDRAWPSWTDWLDALQRENVGWPGSAPGELVPPTHVARQRTRFSSPARAGASASANYWTKADAAELDVIVHAFVDGFYEHRARCAVCAGGGRWCDGVHEAFAALQSWLVFRYRLSKAEWLRRQYDELSLILDGREAA